MTHSFKPEVVEKVARAIAECEWDKSCTALGIPNMPRGGNWSAKLPQAQAALSIPEIAALYEALEWYAEQVAGCRKLGSVGDPYRNALDADGGKRARKALTLFRVSKEEGES